MRIDRTQAAHATQTTISTGIRRSTAEGRTQAVAGNTTIKNQGDASSRNSASPLGTCKRFQGRKSRVMSEWMTSVQAGITSAISPFVRTPPADAAHAISMKACWRFGTA